MAESRSIQPARGRGGAESARFAIYLVHSMLPSARLTQASFEDLDLICADNFARAAKRAGVEQIVYLGGLLPQTEELSPHLASRLEVERPLGRYGVPVTTLRAGLVIGGGGSSFEILTRPFASAGLLGDGRTEGARGPARREPAPRDGRARSPALVLACACLISTLVFFLEPILVKERAPLEVQVTAVLPRRDDESGVVRQAPLRANLCPAPRARTASCNRDGPTPPSPTSFGRGSFTSCASSRTSPRPSTPSRSIGASRTPLCARSSRATRRSFLAWSGKRALGRLTAASDQALILEWRDLRGQGSSRWGRWRCGSAAHRRRPCLVLRLEECPPEPTRSFADFSCPHVSEEGVDALEPVGPDEPGHIVQAATFQNPCEHAIGVAPELDGLVVDVPEDPSRAGRNGGHDAGIAARGSEGRGPQVIVRPADRRRSRAHARRRPDFPPSVDHVRCGVHSGGASMGASLQRMQPSS